MRFAFGSHVGGKLIVRMAKSSCCPDGGRETKEERALASVPSRKNETIELYQAWGHEGHRSQPCTCRKPASSAKQPGTTALCGATYLELQGGVNALTRNACHMLKRIPSRSTASPPPAIPQTASPCVCAQFRAAIANVVKLAGAHQVDSRRQMMVRICNQSSR